MDKILEEVYRNEKVIGESGVEHDVHSHMSKDECESIEKLIRVNNFEKTIEVGCAYGISSLCICDAISGSGSPRHIAIDPYQSTDWDGVGRRNVKLSGYDFVSIIEEPSEIVLPRMLSENEKFDFALIDGMHTFDHTMLDLFYINRLLRVGGIVVVDDLHLPAVNKAVRYVLNYPAYEIVELENLDPRWSSWKRNLVNKIIRYSGKSYLGKFFDQSLVDSDSDIGIQYSMAALRKIGEDDRSWDWYESF